MILVTQSLLHTFLARLDAAFGRAGRLYLVGESSLVFEGWRGWTDHVAFTADVAPEDRAAFDAAVAAVQRALGVAVLDESPADLIPLPDGYRDRAVPAAGAGDGYGGAAEGLAVFHFDPYSVAFRFIARGDEPDYHLVLLMREKGWVTFEEMDARLAALLPRFSMATIQQDPAEFRRKYKGLRQMAGTLRAGQTHRPTVV